MNAPKTAATVKPAAETKEKKMGGLVLVPGTDLFGSGGERKQGKRLSLAPVLKFADLEKQRQQSASGVISVLEVKLKAIKATGNTVGKGNEQKPAVICLFEKNGNEFALPLNTGLQLALGVDVSHNNGKDVKISHPYEGKDAFFNIDFRGQMPSKRGNDAWVLDVELLD